MIRRVALIDRYAAPLEADLLGEFGVDLSEFIIGPLNGGRAWSQFDRLLSVLGGTSSSRYARAMADDDDVARQVLERDGTPADPAAWRPSAADWSQTTELLAQIRDILGKANFKDWTFYPRPENAIDRARSVVEEAKATSDWDRIMAEVEAGQARWIAGDRPVENAGVHRDVGAVVTEVEHDLGQQ